MDRKTAASIFFLVLFRLIEPNMLLHMGSPLINLLILTPCLRDEVMHVGICMRKHAVLTVVIIIFV